MGLVQLLLLPPAFCLISGSLAKAHPPKTVTDFGSHRQFKHLKPGINLNYT
jgi:hypothetical protein